MERMVFNTLLSMSIAISTVGEYYPPWIKLSYHQQQALGQHDVYVA